MFIQLFVYEYILYINKDIKQFWLLQLNFLYNTKIENVN